MPHCMGTSYSGILYCIRAMLLNYSYSWGQSIFFQVVLVSFCPVIPSCSTSYFPNFTVPMYLYGKLLLCTFNVSKRRRLYFFVGTPTGPNSWLLSGISEHCHFLIKLFPFWASAWDGHRMKLLMVWYVLLFPVGLVYFGGNTVPLLLELIGLLFL